MGRLPGAISLGQPQPTPQWPFDTNWATRIGEIATGTTVVQYVVTQSFAEYPG